MQVVKSEHVEQFAIHAEGAQIFEDNVYAVIQAVHEDAIPEQALQGEVHNEHNALLI